MTTVVLAEDLHLVRQGFRAVLDAAGDLKVLGEASDGLEAMRLVEQHEPTVLVTELAVRGMSGFDLAREIRRRRANTRVLILTTQSNRRYLQEAFVNGATGYVVKSAPAADLVEAVRQVANGQRYISAPLTESDLFGADALDGQVPQDAYRALTTREREVLVLAAEGLTNAGVGTQLGISPRTVEVHRANLMRKLGLHSQTELVREALRRGILRSD